MIRSHVLQMQLTSFLKEYGCTTRPRLCALCTRPRRSLAAAGTPLLLLLLPDEAMPDARRPVQA